MKLRYVINNKFIWVLLLTLPLLSVQSIPSAQAVIGDACSYVSDSGNVSGIEGYDDFCIGTEELVQTLNLCKAKANPSSLQEDPGISIEGRCFLFTEDITNTESGDVGSVHGLANGTAVRRDCSNLSSYALLDPETTQTICLDEYQEAAVATYIRLGSIPKAISETLGLYTSVVPPEGIEPTTTPSSIFLGLAPAVYNLYNWALGIGALLALAIIIYGGVLYSASAGNPSRIDEAKKWITSALFGLALLFSTVIILNVVNPRLTTLEDIEITVNPEISVGFSVIGGGGEGALGGVTNLEFPPNFQNVKYVDGYFQMPPSTDGSYFGNPNGNGNRVIRTEPVATIPELSATGGKDAACGKKELIQVIYSVAQRWKEDHPNIPLRVGDLNGGCLNSGICHWTHDFGVDVDISSGVATSRGSNEELSIALAKMFIDTGIVTGIVFDGTDNVLDAVNQYFTSTQGDKLTVWSPGFSCSAEEYTCRNTGFMRRIGSHAGHFHVHIGDGIGATGTGISPGPPNVSCTRDTTDNPEATLVR